MVGSDSKLLFRSASKKVAVSTVAEQMFLIDLFQKYKSKHVFNISRALEFERNKVGIFMKWDCKYDGKVYLTEE